MEYVKAFELWETARDAANSLQSELGKAQAEAKEMVETHASIMGAGQAAAEQEREALEARHAENRAAQDKLLGAEKKALHDRIADLEKRLGTESTRVESLGNRLPEMLGDHLKAKRPKPPRAPEPDPA